MLRKECPYQAWHRAPEPTVTGLNTSLPRGIEPTVALSGLGVADIPDCPLCGNYKSRPGVCWFGEG